MESQSNAGITFEMLPQSMIDSMIEYFDREENLVVVEERLKSCSVVLQYDEYAVTLHNKEELDEFRQALEGRSQFAH